MADVINLRRARKRKARLVDEQKAAENRANFGRTKAEKQRDAAEAARTAKQHEQHALPSVPRFDWSRLARVTPEDPLRVLFSACLLGNATGWDGLAYTEALAVRLAGLAKVRPIAFCPENATLGTPRPLTTIYDGDGRDVRAGRARVLETTGRDVTRQLVEGGEKMLAQAKQAEVELAVLLDVSDSCGSHVVYLGAPEDRRYQKGTGVAAAILMEAGVPVVAQRDTASMQRLIAALDPTFTPDPEAFDFVEHPWYRDYFANGPVGLKLADYEAEKTKI